MCSFACQRMVVKSAFPPVRVQANVKPAALAKNQRARQNQYGFKSCSCKGLPRMTVPVLHACRRFAVLAVLLCGFALAAYGCSAAQGTKTDAGPDLRPLAPDYHVAAQLHPQDMARLARLGYSLVINNRPDGESPDQPGSAEMAKAAEAAGLDYVYLPVRPGHYPAQDLARLQDILARHKGKIAAYCRSGTRAATLWALAQTARGALDPDTAIARAAGAGVHLEAERERLQKLAPQGKR